MGANIPFLNSNGKLCPGYINVFNCFYQVSDSAQVLAAIVKFKSKPKSQLTPKSNTVPNKKGFLDSEEIDLLQNLTEEPKQDN